MTSSPPPDDGLPPAPPPPDDDDLQEFPDTEFDWRPIEEIIGDPETHDDTTFDEFDEVSPAVHDGHGGGSHAPSSGDTILSLAEEYLKSANVRTKVREHLPVLLMADGAKVANWRNRSLQFTTHWYGAGLPYRYLSHVTLLGASGHHKGAVVDQFFHIMGDRAEDQPEICPLEEYKGGSIQGLRGGVYSEKGQKVHVTGAIERMHKGYIHIPEFTQIADLGQASGGAIQTIIAWADSGRMSFETMSGGPVGYPSEATLIVGLQLARLDEVEEVVLGWNRRSWYDRFPPMTVEESLNKNRPEVVPGDFHLLVKLRAALRAMRQMWTPTNVDWSELKQWFDESYLKNDPLLPATVLDEQIAYSMAIGHHMVSGGTWTGDIKIKVGQDLDRILRRAIWNKGLARIGPERRGAHDALEVLKDPHLLGKGQKLPARALERILAARMSVGEKSARGFMGVLVERGFFDVIDGESTGGRKPRILQLRGAKE